LKFGAEHAYPIEGFLRSKAALEFKSTAHKMPRELQLLFVLCRTARCSQHPAGALFLGRITLNDLVVKNGFKASIFALVLSFFQELAARQSSRWLACDAMAARAWHAQPGELGAVLFRFRDVGAPGLALVLEIPRLARVRAQHTAQPGASGRSGGKRPSGFFDCGAHIGLVSHYVAHESRHVDRVWAFEPNGEREKVLRMNAERSQKPMTVERTAVSDFTGAARLIIPDNDDDDSAYIEPAPGGDIQVITLDAYDKPARRGVVMKIDVEGAELRVLRGAAQRLADAPYFVVLFEAHREVARRTGIDPLECVRFLNSIRPCGFSLSGSLSDPLDLSRTFFDQVTNHMKRDVVVWSLPRSA
jgi:FkbM family methyltransferase